MKSWSLLLLACTACLAQTHAVVGIHGSLFTINGHPTYTAESGFPNADTNLIGTLLNVRAVQALFDDANYPRLGSRAHPYTSTTLGPVFFDYPDGKWDPDRQTDEFIAALPEWRRCGLLAFTVNLQGGGPTDGNYGISGPLQPHDNSGFDREGTLKPAYAHRLEKILAAADRLGMVVIVGLFYQGEDERVEVAPDNRYARRAIENAMTFLKSLPYRNVLIEIANEIGVAGYSHQILLPEGIVDAVLLAQKAAAGQFPVSMSWLAGVPTGSARIDAAQRAADYVLIHTNGKSAEQVHEVIASSRRLAGAGRPMLINEDGVSPFNLHAAVDDRVGWGYYDQGWNDYRNGFQSPPTDWKISTPVKWLFFEQVAKLTGSPVPPMPREDAADSPVIRVLGLEARQVVKDRIPVEAVIEDRHPRWPIKRVEFYLDGKPYSYTTTAPFTLGNAGRWDPATLAPGEHTLRVVAFDRRGPAFTESASILEVPFQVAKQ